jgi:hypothetical protein
MDMKLPVLLSTILLSTTAAIARAETTANPVPPPPSSTPISANGVGLLVLGQQQRNMITLERTNYTGDCPGAAITQPKALFVSDQVPSGKKRRVKIENVTSGFKSTPYTDREYKDSNRSETMTLDLDYGHTLKYFRILPGQNRFTYRITERKELIDSGEFTAQVNIQDFFQVRNATWYDTEVCSNNSVALKNCADIRDVREFRCPSGKVLQSEQRDRSASYRTIFANRSDLDIDVELDGERHRLYPGESASFQTSNRFSTSLSIRYRIGKESWQTASVTPAKYMQFRRGHGDRIELTDYDRDQHGTKSYKFRNR